LALRYVRQLSLCEANDELRKHDHLVIDFEDQQLRYHDPRRFGCILWLDENNQEKLIDTLGPEPLSDDLTLFIYLKNSQKNVGIKIALMDNHNVVGVGNIYATESLFNVGIHPAQPASTLSLSKLKA
jgi:formamidopyrimidine-DNA glycosylase